LFSVFWGDMGWDNMKQPAAILVLPVFYQNLPVSAILVQILVNTSFPVSCRYRKILGNTGYTSIADTGKYWLCQYCRYWKILILED